jgi:hypothetical protein
MNEVGGSTVALSDFSLELLKVIPKHPDRTLLLVDDVVEPCFLLTKRLLVLVEDPVRPIAVVFRVKEEPCLDSFFLDVVLKRLCLVVVIPLLKMAECDIEVPAIRSCLLKEVHTLNLTNLLGVETVSDVALDKLLTVLSKRATRQRTGVDAGDIDGKLGVKVSGRERSHFDFRFWELKNE